MKKVIFLDIDGVLNTDDFLMLTDLPQDFRIEKHLVDNLNTIIAATGAVCVLSSDWRWTFSAERMQSHLKDNFGFIGQIISITPTNCKSRFNQIQQWFDDQDEFFDHFMIIDDTEVLRADVSFENNLSIKHFVRTNSKFGLTKEDANQVIAKFAM